MKVVGVRRFGGPEALEVVEVDEPHPGPGEIRVRVHAAAVNPTDTLFRAGVTSAEALRDRPPPYVPGMDVAGVVDEVGEGARQSTGDHVMAITLPRSRLGGGYAEHVVVPSDSATAMPLGTTYAEACTLPMNGMTAQLTLDRLALGPGRTLAVTGAAGAYGGYVVQLAKARGLRVVADASPEDEPLVRRLGADVVVARGPEVSLRIRQALPDGVDAVADGVVIGAPLLAAVRDGGAIAAVRGFGAETERGIVVHEIWVSEYAREWDKLDELRRLADTGAVTLRVAQTYPPERAADAHRRLEAGGVRGRLVIMFRP
ncbi:NADP-dependent oxidoreductase [Actinoallomurus acaciae]|uniref:NADP-dependent oxidoreductase n=1 Tax=Actinoallomurus acaciae TaxID=502577 RepID=A0ABV5YQ48_9ACTN